MIDKRNKNNSKKISIRLTIDEYNEYKTKLEKSKLSGNDFIKKSIFNTIILDKNIEDEKQNDIKELIYLLRKIGVNLNQLQKILNRNSLKGNLELLLLENYNNTIKELQNLIKRLSDLI